MMKKKKIIIVILLVVLIAVVIVKCQKRAGGDAPEATLVQAATVQQKPTSQETQAIGTLTARSVTITPEFSGHVQKVLFTDGAFVKAGTVLIQLDDSVYKAQLESAKAQLVFCENDFRRKSILGKKGLVTKQDVDLADSNLKQKTAEVQEKQVMVSKMQLVAPFDGVIGKTTVNPGDYVSVNQPLVTLTDTQHLHVEYSVPEKLLPQLRLGEDVTITTSTYPNTNFTGKIAYISPTVSTDNRSVSLYAEIPNDKNKLAAGMFVNIIQSLGSNDNAIYIPARSLVPGAEGEQVYKIVDGKAQAVAVKVGKRTEDQAEILQGLAPNDVVITDGQFKIGTGMPVKIKS